MGPTDGRDGCLLARGVTGKTVVLTGAMIPYAFGSSTDCSISASAVSFAQVLPPGIYIAMNGQHFAWDRVARIGRQEPSNNMNCRLPNAEPQIHRQCELQMINEVEILHLSFNNESAFCNRNFCILLTALLISIAMYITVPRAGLQDDRCVRRQPADSRTADRRAR